MKLAFTLLFAFFCHFGISQKAEKPLKEEVHTYVYRKIDNETLKFDFYKPKQSVKDLPLLIYVHGGGFIVGSRDSKSTVQFIKKMVNNGYAVASVSYRLSMKDKGFGCSTTAKEKLEAINKASEDVALATRFIIDNNKSFQIDTQKIILIGSSAGAETVLNLAYVYTYSDTLIKNNYAGVISFAGAISCMDCLTAKNAIPTQLFHGTGDALVPYQTAPHHYCGDKDDGYMMLYGSAPITQRLKGLGEAVYFYTAIGGSHSWAGKPMYQCIDEIVDFINNDVINPKYIRQTERVVYE